MAYSTQRATSDGTLQLLLISIEFFDQSEITVYLDDVLTTGFSWATAKSIQFPAPVANGVQVLIRRTTDLSKPRHVFTQGASFNSITLDEDFTQVLHIAQEALEGSTLRDVYADVDMHLNQFYNLRPAVLPTEAVTKAQLDAYTVESAAALRADLASRLGSTYVGDQAQAGAPVRTVASVLRDTVNLASYNSLKDALATGRAVHINADVSALAIPAGDVVAVLAGLDRILPDGELQLNVPEGTFTTTSGNFGYVGQSGALIRIVGASTLNTTVVGINSVAGVSGNYTVEVNLVSAAGVSAGMFLKLDNVVPMLTLSGDNSVFRKRIGPNELLRKSALLGVITASAGGGSASFASVDQGVLTDYIQNGDLLTIKGTTLPITSVGSLSVAVSGAFLLGATSSRDYFVSRPNSGTISTGGVLSSTVSGTGSAFLTEANKGDAILAAGGMYTITDISGAGTCTVSPAANIPAGTPYSVITHGVCHEGTHEVLAVSGNRVTVRNRWQGPFAPPVNRITGGEAKVVRTVLKNTGTGDGFVFREGASLAWLQDMVLQGSYGTSGSHGLALNGRTPEGPTQSGPIGVVSMGDGFAVVGWGRGAFLGLGCQLQGRRAHFSGNVFLGIWALEASTVAVREAVISGNARGIQLNGGATLLCTDNQVVGNAGDGLNVMDGATVYGEIPNFYGNGGMNIRLTSPAGFHVNEGVIAGAGQSNIYGVQAKGDLSRCLFYGGARHNVELTAGSVMNAAEMTSTGSRGTAGSGQGVFLDDSALTCNASTVLGNAGSTMSVTGPSGLFSSAGSNLPGVLAFTTMARGRLSNSKVGTVNVGVGNYVLVDGVSPVATLVGVARLNEWSNSGSVVSNGAGTSFGVAALSIGGVVAPQMAYFSKTQLVYDFPSVPAHSQAFLDVAVTGVTTAGMAANVNLNALAPGMFLWGQIITAGSVRVWAFNNTPAAIDLANATLTVTVQG